MEGNLKQWVENYTAFDHDDEIAQLKVLTFLSTESNWLGKSNTNGHITASVWIVNDNCTRTFLTHHKKLGKWIQPGGHTEPGETIWESAEREAREETGMSTLALSDMRIFDIDAHWIPAYKDDPAHWHFDLRFLIYADDLQAYGTSDESHAVQWVDLDKVQAFTLERSVLRMVEKTIKMR